VFGAHEDGVDRISFGAGERVPFERSVAFRVTDDWFDGAAPPKLSFDRRRAIARILRYMGIGRRERVATMALVDIGASDRHAGKSFDLRVLVLQRMAVTGRSGSGADAEDELAAIGARVGDSDRDFESKPIARARLALGDAFDLDGHATLINRPLPRCRKSVRSMTPSIQQSPPVARCWVIAEGLARRRFCYETELFAVQPFLFRYICVDVIFFAQKASGGV
jgi:hypothetical protein